MARGFSIARPLAGHLSISICANAGWVERSETPRKSMLVVLGLAALAPAYNPAACRAEAGSLKSVGGTNCGVVGDRVETTLPAGWRTVIWRAAGGKPVPQHAGRLPPLPVADQQPIRCGVVAVVLRQDRLLVIRRSRHVTAPRAICFPGGGIEPDESEEQALVRELQEELTALVLPTRRLWQSKTRWGVELAWWRAELAPDAVPVAQPAEVESVHWYTPAELTGLGDLLDSNREFLAAIARGEVRLD